MATPDPRRGDEPGDPDVTPGQPKPGGDDEPETPEPADHPASDESAGRAYGGDDDLKSGHHGPTANLSD